ncbi:MAG: hypothetical protein [Bacteriophage sp.]|nr:MAG: hypothetical protein [Bacteriophage sp.]
MYNKSLQKISQIPIITIESLIIDSITGKLILGRREPRDSMASSYWEIPNDALLSGETYTEAAERILKKYIGILPIDDVKILYEFQYIGFDIKIHYVVKITVKGQNIDLNKKTPEYNWKWVSKKNFPYEGQYQLPTLFAIKLWENVPLQNKDWKIYKLTEC